MLRHWRPSLAWLLLVIFVVSGVPQSVDAVTCSASVSPQSLNPNHSADLTFTVTNAGAADVLWVRFTVPSGDFQITGGSSSGWLRSIESSAITFTGGTLSISGNHTFTVRVQTGSSGAAAAAWNVAAAENSDGSGSAVCSGDTGVAIGGDTTPPVISSVQATSVTTTGATITWNTNESSSSAVQYGTTTSYGSTATASGSVTSHSVPLTGLATGTTYHYRVQSTDAADNTASSSDTTFTTGGASSLAISNVSVSAITTSHATITWTTNVSSSSRVDYGLTTSYGGTQDDDDDVTSHSLTVTGLSAATVYHYRVQSTDSTPTTVQSSDNTFTTAAQSGEDGSSGSSSGGSGSSSTGVTTPARSRLRTAAPRSSSGPGTESGGTSVSSSPLPSVAPPPDRLPPAVNLITDFSQAYATPPTLTGTARDNRGVARVDYSLDGGRNWLRASVVTDPGSSAVTFSAALPELTDGNYGIRMRARDHAGNEGFSALATLIIDQIPPQVGTALYAVAAQPVTGAQAELQAVMAGLDQRVTVSAVGGATVIDFIARPLDGGDVQVFSLVQDAATGLWNGAISLARPGDYELWARARDGAGNETQRLLRRVTAVRGGFVTAGEQPVADATVTVFSFNELTRTFEPWDATPFWQTNPQQTDLDGAFQFFLPPGRYYVAAQAPGWRPAQTDIFTLRESQPLYITLPLLAPPRLTVGAVSLPLPAWWPTRVPITFFSPPQTPPLPLPAVTVVPALPVTNATGTTTLPELLAGRPALLTFLTHWSPQVSEQLIALEAFEARSERVVVPILVQSTSAQTHLLQARGGYSLPLWADPTGEVAVALGIDSTPTHIWVDGQGVIEKVHNGLQHTF